MKKNDPAQRPTALLPTMTAVSDAPENPQPDLPVAGPVAAPAAQADAGAVLPAAPPAGEGTSPDQSEAQASAPAAAPDKSPPDKSPDGETKTEMDKGTLSELSALAQAMQGVPEEAAQPAPRNDKISLFSPLKKEKEQWEELDYLSEVDAALARKPVRSVYLLSVAVGFFFVLTVIWAALADVDEVTRADGQVVPSQRTQSIQNLEGGILQEILVREGAVVQKGDPLARLENTLAGSSFRDTYTRMLDNRAAIIRLEAEQKNEEPNFPENFAKEFEVYARDMGTADQQQQASQIIRDHMGTFRARHQQREAELGLLEAQVEQRRKEVEEQFSRKNQLTKSLALAAEQRDIAFTLMQRRNLSRSEYLRYEQTVVSLEGDLQALEASIPKTQAAMREAEQRMQFRQAELNTAINEEISKRRIDLNSLRQTLSAGGDRVDRTELRSPVRGTVKQIYINSLGGVVKPGESIMDIVPLDETLLVEAKVRPADVAFLHPDQKAVVKISAYDFSIFGGLEGRLEQISADTIEDKHGELYYLVKVRTHSTTLQYQNKELAIIPGMMATVDILTGKKSVLDYLLKPILKARQNALRER